MPPVGTTVGVTGVAAAGSAMGSVILNAAGWTVNGAPIVKLATVVAAGAAGAATIIGPSACCAASLMALRGNNNRENNSRAAGGGVISSVITAGGFGAIGALELKLKGVGIGYVAASTAIGTPIVVIGIATVAGAAGLIGYALCCKKPDSERNEPTVRYPKTYTTYAPKPVKEPESLEIFVYPIGPDDRPDFSVKPVNVTKDGSPVSLKTQPSEPVTQEAPEPTSMR